MSVSADKQFVKLDWQKIVDSVDYFESGEAAIVTGTIDILLMFVFVL